MKQPTGRYKIWEKIKHRQPRPERGLWYWQPGSLKGLDASTLTEKESLQKRKQMQKNNQHNKVDWKQDNKPIKTQTGSRKPPEKINFWQERGDCLSSFLKTTRYWNYYSPRIPAFYRQLGHGLPTCRPYAGRGYLCVSRKEMSSVIQGKMVLITRFPASID